MKLKNNNTTDLNDEVAAATYHTAQELGIYYIAAGHLKAERLTN